jgi:hypothetical protein
VQQKTLIWGLSLFIYFFVFRMDNLVAIVPPRISFKENQWRTFLEIIQLRYAVRQRSLLLTFR